MSSNMYTQYTQILLLKIMSSCVCQKYFIQQICEQFRINKFLALAIFTTLNSITISSFIASFKKYRQWHEREY